MGMDSVFEKPEPQPTAAVQPDIPSTSPVPTPAPEPIKAMPTFANSTPPTIAATEPITEREPLPKPDPVAEALKAPIKPAAPVPGSIGSAVSVPAETPAPESKAPEVDVTSTDPVTVDTPNVSEKTESSDSHGAQKPEAKSVSFDSPIEMNMTSPQKKSNKKTMIILVIIGAIVIVALVIILIIMLTSSKTADKPDNPSTPQIVNTTVSCNRTLNPTELLEYGNALSGEVQLVANYANGKMSSISTGYVVEYENTANASIAKDKFRADYVGAINKIGFTTDPFESEYNVNDATLEVYHDAALDDITEENMSIFNLTFAKDGTIDTTAAAIKKASTNLGLTCTEE